MSLLQLNEISVHDGATQLIAPVSLTLEPGVPLIILGETGSGKSLLAQAVMGTLPQGLTARGRITLGKDALDPAQPARFRALWGRRIAVLPQEPWLSLDPLMRAAPQIAETHHLVRGLTRSDAAAQAQKDLAALDLAAVGQRYPHELSGGMAQRVAIAAARAGGARIVIADEPTKGLDAARRDDVARLLLDALGRDGGLAVITHDLALAQMIGGQIIIMREGKVVEAGQTSAVFAAPTATYTRDLIAADPAHWPARSTLSMPVPGLAPAAPVVAAKGLSLSRGGQRLIEDLDIAVHPGRVLGITGPSGCGKSSLGDVLLGLLAPDAGAVTRAPGLPRTALQKLYQDPVAAFPPRRALGMTLADVAALHGARAQDIPAQMERLRLDPALLNRLPGAVSGGELQRLALLRVMLARPAFIFADEPTSRLDPITQREVITLLRKVATEDGVAVVLVSHDMALIDKTADRVVRLGLGGQEQAPVLQDAFAG